MKVKCTLSILAGLFCLSVELLLPGAEPSDDLKYPPGSVVGSWSIENLSLTISRDSDMGQTTISIGSQKLILPYGGLVHDVQVAKGVFALLTMAPSQGGGYGDSEIIVIKLIGGKISFFHCARPIQVSKTSKTYCWLTGLLGVDENGIVQLEVSYFENPHPPTRVLQKVVLWDSSIDKEAKSSIPKLPR